jgi:glycosyltransferase involved in cell wall biosynthesis
MRKEKTPYYSIVIPIHNEEESVSPLFAKIVETMEAQDWDFEIVFVDDASTDGSAGIADGLADEHPEVVVIHHAKNRKLGGALKTGFAAAAKGWILYIDSDLPIRMDDALQAVPLAEDADIVIGWRKSRAESLRREFISWVYNRLIRVLFKLRVRDVNFAFKLFRRSFLDRIILTYEGSFIDAELLLEMKREGARFAEMGLDYYPRVAGVSTLASYGVVLKILREMIKYRKEAYGRISDNFGGQRRRLWAERGDQSGDRVGVPQGGTAQREPHAERTGVR